MSDIFDKKLEIELTLGELEELIFKMRVANKVLSGDVESDLGNKLQNILLVAKMSI